MKISDFLRYVCMCQGFPVLGIWNSTKFSLYSLLNNVVERPVRRGKRRNSEYLFRVLHNLSSRVCSFPSQRFRLHVFIPFRSTFLMMISLMLVVKFLMLRTPAFVLDIWEVTFGFRQRITQYIYIVDLSNFLILLNSATNCVSIFGGCNWLHDVVCERNVLRKRRDRQFCLGA